MRNQKGFSLLELVIYLGIFSIAAGFLTGVIYNSGRISVQENAVNDVNNQSRFLIQRIQRVVADASAIETPAATNTPGTVLKLRMSDPSLDPTCIDVSNGAARIMQGNDGVNKQSCYTAQAQSLTDSVKVSITSLQFTRLSNPGGKDTIQIDLTVASAGTNPFSAVTKSFKTTTLKAQAATFDSDLVPSVDNTYNLGLSANRWVNGLFSGSVGIGTTNTSRKLSVVSPGINEIATFSTDSGSPYGYITINSGANGTSTLKLTDGIYDNNYGGVSYNKNTHALGFISNGNYNQMAINSSGQVTIGLSTAPYSLSSLTVGNGSSNTYSAIKTTGLADASQVFVGQNNSWYTGVLDGTFGTSDSSYWISPNGTSNGLMIDSNGNAKFITSSSTLPSSILLTASGSSLGTTYGTRIEFEGHIGSGSKNYWNIINNPAGGSGSTPTLIFASSVSQGNQSPTTQLAIDNTGSIYTVNWTGVLFGTGWNNYAGYQNVQYKKLGDLVFMRGTGTSGANSWDTNSVIATLPSGFRPSAKLIFSQAANANTTTDALITVDTNGNVSWFSSGARSGWISLDGITFSVN